MIKVTLEFTSIEQAIVALGRFIKDGDKPSEPKKQTNAEQIQAAIQGKPIPMPPGLVTEAERAAKKKRRARSDKGVPRGSYIAAAVGAASEPAPAAVPVPAAPAPKPESAPVAPAPAASQADAQKALEKLFEVKGLEIARQAMARFGANRMRDMKSEHYAEFVKHAEGVLAGGAV